MRAFAALLLLLHGSFAPGGAQEPVTLKSSLLEQLRTTHTQQDWFVPLKPELEGVTPAQATWKPKGGDHSIGQLARLARHQSNVSDQAFRVGLRPQELITKTRI